MPPETAQELVPVQTPAPTPVGKDLSAKSADLIAKYTAAAEATKDEPEADAKVKAEPKAKPTKAEAKVPAKVDPKTIKLETPAAAIEPEPEAIREKARYYLQHGDVAKAIETSFGDLEGVAMADDVREALARKLGVGSAQWEKIRKFEQNAKRQLSQKEQQVSQLVDQVREQYAGFNQAKAAYDQGDYETAFKAAFGEDLADFQRKAIGQRISKNPEVEQLKVQLERERQARLEFEHRQSESALNADAERQIAAYVTNLGEQLNASDDPQVSKFSANPRFVRRVFEIQRDGYDAARNVSVPVSMAAAAARDEVLSLLGEWEYSGGNTAQSVQAAALPEQPTRAPARGRNLSHARAAEATSSPRKLPTKDLISKYTKLIELSPATK